MEPSRQPGPADAHPSDPKSSGAAAPKLAEAHLEKAPVAGTPADKPGDTPAPLGKNHGQGCKKTKGPPPRWSWPWWHDLIFGNRFDSQARGKRFVILLMVMLTGTVAVYVVLHNIFPPKATALRARDFVQLNHHGEATIKSVEDINWFIGEKKAGPLLQALQVRNVQIRDLCEHIRLSLGDLQARLGPASVEDIRPVLEAFESTKPPEVPNDDEEAEAPEGWRRWVHDRISGHTTVTNRPAPGLVRTNLAEIRQDLDELKRTLEQNQFRNEEWSRWQDQVSTNLVTGLDTVSRALRDMLTNLPCITNMTLADRPRWETNLPRITELRELVLRQPFQGDTHPGRTNSAGAMLQSIGDVLRRLNAALPDQGHEASMAFGNFQAGLTPGDRNLVGLVLLADLHTSLLKLEALTAEQVGVVVELRQPEKFGMFWSTSTGVLWEITFWALFGVFTNLLLNITEQLSQGNYRPVECWVSIAKLVYGPGVALALGIALIAGLISLLGEDQRVWVLPLLAFLVGFKARKAASVIDHLATSTLNKIDKSIDMPPADRLAAINESDRRLQALIPPPNTLSELRTQGKRKAEALATATVARQVSGH